jgi:small-conductance mechanosensitive channel
MQFTQVINYINNSSLTNTQLNEIGQALEHAKSQLQYRTIRQLQLGDRVSFRHTRNGQVIQGQVEKIAIRYVNVRTASGVYRVPANMLTPVAELA